MINIRHNIKTVIIAGSLLLFPNISKAQVPTFDPSNIANIVTRVQNLSGQLKQIQQTAKQVEKAKATIGDSVSSVGSQWESLKSGETFSKGTASLKAMKPKSPKKLKDLGFNDSMAENPQETQNFLNDKVLESSDENEQKEQSIDELAEKRKAKDAMLKEAATSAYANSLNVRNSASQVDTKMKAVEDAAANATTERDDLAALTQATTIMVEDLASLNTISASGLEIDAAAALNGM